MHVKEITIQLVIQTHNFVAFFKILCAVHREKRFAKKVNTVQL